jgi:hypothetical protein
MPKTKTRIQKKNKGSMSVANSMDTRRHWHNKRINPIQLRPFASSGITSKVNKADLKYRLPSSGSITSAVDDPLKTVPISVIRDSINVMLIRMEREKRLPQKKTAAEILNDIFPGPKTFDKAKFESYFDEKDQSIIYGNAKAADSPVKDEESSKLKSFIEWAIKILRVSQGMGKSMIRVFGSKTNKAKAIYKKAGDVLQKIISSKSAMEAGISTDYNRDDPEVGMGGWANFAKQKMHLDPDIVKATDSKETLITLIHESTHLADSDVDDNGIYYPGSTPKDTFTSLDEDAKITTASFFEEFPRRWLGKSVYDNEHTFTPGKTIGGGTPSLASQAKSVASAYYTNVWDRAVDIFTFLRNTKVKMDKGDRTLFDKFDTEILKASQKMGLTIHQQTTATKTINSLDVILAEGIARAASLLAYITQKKLPDPLVASPADVNTAGMKLVDDALIYYKALLGDLTKDRALISYLNDQYHSPTFWED